MAKFRILSFDGGGIRGALTANLLKRLNRESPQLIEKTDLFAGTSTGSFIALGLAYGLNIEEIAGLYSVENGSYIFSHGGLGLIRPKYGNRRLREVLLRIFPENLKLRDLKKYVVILAFRLSSPGSESWSPIFFNNFPDSNTKDVLVIDAALASSAAPVYFPSYNRYIDGGLVANNPCMAALSIASDPFYANQSCDEICLLSIGTGFSPHKITADTTRWGLLQWQLNTNPVFPMETLMFEGAVEADSYFSYQILKDRFYRLNPKLNQSIALDDYNQIPNLVSLAERYNISETLDWIGSYWDGTDFKYIDTKEDFNLKRARYWHNLHNRTY